jgi:hypothetical protein
MGRVEMKRYRDISGDYILTGFSWLRIGFSDNIVDMLMNFLIPQQGV